MTYWNKSEYLKILSSRDVSGPLRFYPYGSSFAILNIKSEINFADTISYSDYKEIRNEIKNYKESGFSHYEYKEKIKIGNIENEDFLVNIDGGESCFVSKCTFIIFSILTFGQLYKLILLCMTEQITFVIRKIISTRYNISNDAKYEPYNPVLIFPRQTFQYGKEDICHIDNSVKVKPPTPEELTKSLQYKDFIPQFGQNQNMNGKSIEVYNNYNYNPRYMNNNIIPVNYQLNQSGNTIN